MHLITLMQRLVVSEFTMTHDQTTQHLIGDFCVGTSMYQTHSGSRNDIK